MFKKLFGRPTTEPAAGSAAPTPATTSPSRSDAPKRDALPVHREPGKLRVLFLCIGNSCRSPMAEGLARKYGADVIIAESAGIMPINRVDPLSIKVMHERNIDISSAFPKGPDLVNPQSFDLIINMSGSKMPSLALPIEEWNVPDPIGLDEAAFRKTADQLEQLVMRLILQIRLKQHPAVSKARSA